MPRVTAKQFREIQAVIGKSAPRKSAKDSSDFGLSCSNKSVSHSGMGHVLTLPYPPSTNHLYATVNGRRVLSAKGRRYKSAAATIAMVSGMRPLGGDVQVYLHVYRPRRAGDLDNSLKACLDSLKGIAWGDDSQITSIFARRYEDKVNPRVEISVVEDVQEAA